MSKNFVKGTISSPSAIEAYDISRKLVEERIVAGTRITSGPSHYRFEDEVHIDTYFNITVYTVKDRKEDVREKVQSISSENVPIIEFVDIDGNDRFESWIEENTDY